MIEQNFLKSNGKLSFSDFFSWAFNLTWGRKKGLQIVIALIIISVIGFIIGLFTSSISKLILGSGSTTLFFIWRLVFIFLDLIITSVFIIGLFNLALGIVRLGNVSTDLLFRNIGWKKIWRVVGCNVIIGFVGFLIGLLSFIFIPVFMSGGSPILKICLFGLPFLILFTILGMRFMFPYYAIVDKGLGSIAALRYSWNITRGRAGEIFLVGLCFALMMFAFCLFCMIFHRLYFLFIGLIIVFYLIFIPVVLLALVKYYVIISEKYERDINGLPDETTNIGNQTKVENIPNISNITNAGNFPDTDIVTNIGNGPDIQIQ